MVFDSGKCGVILLAGIFLLAGCGRSKAPAGILKRDEMVATLIELYLQEERVIRVGVTRDSAQILFNHLRPKLFQKWNVPDSVFKKSYDYYNARPEELQEIYDIVIDSLSLRQQKALARPAK